MSETEIADYSTKVLYQRIFSYVKPYKWVFIIGIVANVAFSALDASFTWMVKPLMDQGFIGRDLNFIKWVPVIAFLAMCARGAASFFASTCMAYVARSVVMSFRQNLFRHYLALPARYYDHHSSGQMLSKLLYDIEQVAQVSSEALINLLQCGALVIGLFIVMFSVSWRLTLLYLLCVPGMAVIVKWMNKRTRRVSLRLQAIMGQVTEVAEETIEAYREVRTYGGQAYETEKFDAATTQTRNQDMKVAVTKAASTTAVLVTAAVGVAGILYLAISPGSQWMLSAGSFSAFIGAMIMIIKPLKRLTAVNSTIARGLAGAQSVFEILDQPLESDTGTTYFSKPVRGELCFDNVSFAYEGVGEVLSNVHLTIRAGACVALVGHSGSGKTTLASLVGRFYEVTGGAIYLDGINLQDLPLAVLRAQIAYVSQHISLFNDTIANNIAYGVRDRVSLEDIQRSATAAHAMDFIRDLPDGLQTRIGENGVLLSGGQRQRLAIARAILKNCPILILDEATSALDTVSERHIQAALKEVMRDRTSIVIAHRLSTVEHADQIVVLDKGRIVEQGTHNQLLAQKRVYANLHALQFQPELDIA